MTRPATVHELNEKAAEAADSAPLLHPNLNVALVAAINELTVIGKSRTADAGSYSYEYADLADVTNAVKTVLSNHGLAVRTPVHAYGDGLAVTVIFLHVSGETLADAPLPFPRGRDAQATGSAITYFRRYALLASLNLATGDDDDGAKAIPAAPMPVWNHNMVKARLVELFDGDKEKAAEAYRVGHGGEQEPSAGLADRLHADWVANQPAEPEGGES